MVQITVDQNYGVTPYKAVPTVKYGFDRNLAVWLQFQPKTNVFFLQQLIMNKTQLITRNQVLRPTLSFHASHCWALSPS